jgi:hypothetical protein
VGATASDQIALFPKSEERPPQRRTGDAQFLSEFPLGREALTGGVSSSLYLADEESNDVVDRSPTGWGFECRG